MRNLALLPFLASLACTDQGRSESERQSGRRTDIDVRISHTPVTTVGNLPDYTAPRAESVLQPERLFGLGTYQSRGFGCCSPKHLGVDLVAMAGSAVRAIAPGVVLPSPISGPHCQYGYVVAVWTTATDGAEFVSVYGHLSGRDGLEPRLAGSVRRGDVIGYVGHNGGDSPAGSRCGTDDENGDGDAHLHLGVRLGHPPSDAAGNLSWVYYGYGGHGAGIDEAFTDPVVLANCRGTHAGLASAGSWLQGASEAVAGAYCQSGGYKLLGDSNDSGGGNTLHPWFGVLCQNFFRSGGYGDGETIICYHAGSGSAYLVKEGFWGAYKLLDGPRMLGAPTSIEENSTQSFERGRMTWDSEKVSVFLGEALRYEMRGTTLTEVDQPDASSSPVITDAGSSDHDFPMMRPDAGQPVVIDAGAPDNGSSETQRDAGQPVQDAGQVSPGTGGAVPDAGIPVWDDPNIHDPDYTECGRYGFNKIVNGAFHLDPLSCGWAREDHRGGSLVEQVCSGPFQCEAKIRAGVAGEIYETQFYQLVSVYAGTRYQLKFTVRADALVGFQLQLMQSGSPWTNEGLNEWLSVNQSNMEVERQFTATMTDGYAKLAFQIGQTTNTFWIDHVWLEELLGP